MRSNRSRRHDVDEGGAKWAFSPADGSDNGISLGKWREHSYKRAGKRPEKNRECTNLVHLASLLR